MRRLTVKEDIATVEELVCYSYHLNPEDLQSVKRGKQTKSEARQVIIYICLTSEIANKYDMSDYYKRDRATIYHSQETIQDYMDIDKRFKKKMEELLSKAKALLCYDFSNFSL